MERRIFLTTTAAATAASYTRILGANDRVNVGVIGAGGQGGSVWREFMRNSEVNPVAACDVYEPNLEKALSDSGNKAKGYRDFRKLLEHKGLDAVIIGTPDHWHAVQTIMACQAGLDVYVEKPMSLTVHEGRLMVEAARKYKRVVQVGSQQRSGVHYKEAVELIRSGGIGEVCQVEAGHEQNIMPGVANEARTPPQLPANFDYDMWLGPAPKVPYDPLRGIYNFRSFWDYSGGQMTNWGAHNIDVGRWALGVEAPQSVAGFGGRLAVKDGGETPDVQAVIYRVPGAVITWDVRTMNGIRGAFLVFHGTKGTLDLSRTGYRITGEQWKKKRVMEDKEVRPEGAQRSLSVLHVGNFLACMRTREKPNADVTIGHATATMCHLGNIATRLGRSLQWDAQAERVVDDEEANGWLRREHRDPWKLESV